MTKLTNAEKDKLDNTCGNLRVTKLGTHVKSLEDFVNQGPLATRATDVTAAINELYGLIVNNDCATIQIPPPGFFTLFGNDEDGKLYVYYNDEDNPPVFQHIEDEEDDLNGTLYLYIADPEGENHYCMEVGHYIAVSHLDDYYTKTQSNTRFGVTVQKQQTAESGYAATYVVKQNNAQVGDKINIPTGSGSGMNVVKVTSLADFPDDPTSPQYHENDNTVYYLTQDDPNYPAKKGYYIWNDTQYRRIDYEGSGKEDTSNKVTSISSSSTDSQYPSAKLLYDQLALKQNAATAFSGNYNDLTNKPSIPSKTSDLTNDGNGTNAFVTKSNTSGLIKNDGNIDTNTYLTSSSITGKEDTSNKVTSISSSSTDSQYPSAKLLYDQLALKQNAATAFSGNYNDLTNKPSIPSKTSDLTNDGDGTNAFLTQHQDISGKEDVSNKVASWSGTTTDVHYPSEKLVKNSLDAKLDNIEFINAVSDITHDGIFILTSFVLETEDLEMSYADGSQFVVGVYDHGEPYAVGESVQFQIGNYPTVSKVIDQNGEAKYTINLGAAPDPYTITTSFRGKTVTNTIRID